MLKNFNFKLDQQNAWEVLTVITLLVQLSVPVLKYLSIAKDNLPSAHVRYSPFSIQEAYQVSTQLWTLDKSQSA